MYALTVGVFVMLALEGAARLATDTPTNIRFETAREIERMLGFPALKDIFQPDDYLFWRLRPNLVNHALAGRFPESDTLQFGVSTDALGSRVVMPAAPSPAQQNVLFVGDSCTFGLGVDDHETFPSLLQERLPGVRCINCGVPGYTALQCRVFLEQYASQHAPDAVVITVGRNDDLSWDGKSDLEHTVLLKQARNDWTRASRFAMLLKGVLRPPPPPPIPTPGMPLRPRLTDDEYRAEVTTMVDWCRRRGIEPVLVIWPQENQMTTPGSFTKQIVIADIAAKGRVRCVNLIPVFQANAAKPLFLDMVHASPIGCALAADGIEPVLRDALGLELETGKE